MGDGNFKWWAGIGQTPESYQGPFDTSEQAIAQMRSEDGDEFGFTICEGDKAIASTDIYDAGDILERYEEHNEECWGEDGPDITASPEQQRDLERAFGEMLQAWFERHKIRPHIWSMGETRHEQYFPPAPRPDDPTDASPSAPVSLKQT